MDELELELKCCCCGKTIDTLKTPWSVELVNEFALWTRVPCGPCKLDLATNALLRSPYGSPTGAPAGEPYDPRD